MMRLNQPSFAKGELSPELFGRTDTALYAVGLAKARNMIVHTYGGISRRPGSKWIGPCADHTYVPRLVEFQFKTTDSYVLEIGDFYMRFIREDGHVLEAAKNITDITKNNPAVITSASHGFSDGDEVFFSGIVGMTELNGNRYYVTSATANTFRLLDQVTGASVSSASFGGYISGGTVARVYEIETPWAIADVFDLKFTQNADMMTFVHTSYSIYELTRSGHTSWTLTALDLGPTITGFFNVDVTADTTGSETQRYRVTAIAYDTEEEGLPGVDNGRSMTVTGATQANPVVVTAIAHGFSDGDEIIARDFGGMTETHNNRYVVTNKTTDTFELYDEEGFAVNGTSFTAYTSGGTVRPTFTEITNGATTIDNTISWNKFSSAGRYAVYRLDNGVYGLIGETETGSFKDDNIAADTSISPPKFRDPFKNTNDQPGAVGYYEQRRVFGGSLNQPDTSEFSQTGNQSNFNRSFPQQADDAITATLNARQVNEIRHYVALNDLVVLTSGSEWRVTAGQDSAFTPETIRQKPQTYWGSSHRPPVVIGNTVLYVTEDESNVRSLGYSLEIDGYRGSNLNTPSRHLLAGYTITDWCHTRLPESRLYMVRSDGKMLCLSFDQEQEVIAWTWWETSGSYEACAALRGGGTYSEDSLYVVVRRIVNGNTVRYIEVMRQTHFDDVRDCFFMDCGLSYDEPVTITNATAADPVVITAAGHGFSNGDTVDIFDIVWEPDTDSFDNETQPDQLNTKRFLVANKATNNFELTDLDGNNIDGSAFNAYVSGGTVRKAVSTVTGLEHLEGRAVTILADGNVQSGTVASSQITLARKFSRIHVGLPNVADMETLNIETGQGSVAGMQKRVIKLTVRFNNSRGLFFGPDSDNLTEMKQRDTENMADPTALLTGEKELYPSPSWNSNGRVFLRQRYPLPMTILGVIPTLEFADD